MQPRQILFSLACAGALALAAPLALAQKQEREAAASPDQLSEVGQGQHLGRQALKPGAFITPRHRQAVQGWLAKHQGGPLPCLAGWRKDGDRCAPPAASAAWKIGTALAAGTRLDPVPAGLLSALPPAPPGNRYALVNGDIVLMASASRIVVDAVAAR